MYGERDHEHNWKAPIVRFRRYVRNMRPPLLKLIILSIIVVIIIFFLRVKEDSKYCFAGECDFGFPRIGHSVPLIVVVTPTYRRATRLADMTRFSNTLKQIRDLHWIVVEDSSSKVKHVDRLLSRTGLPYTYLAAKTVPGYPRRGWYQRTTALRYLRNNTANILNGHKDGVLYFGDDDNSYDTRLFTDYLRRVKKLGMWAVGMVGGTPVESPDVVNGTVVGFKVKWNPKRKFAVDMAGFGVNLKVVLNSTAEFGTTCSRGGGAPETCLLEDLGLERSDIEPFGMEKEFDRDILVWHTKTRGANYNMTLAKLNGYIFESDRPAVKSPKNGTKAAISSNFTSNNTIESGNKESKP